MTVVATVVIYRILVLISDKAVDVLVIIRQNPVNLYMLNTENLYLVFVIPSKEIVRLVKILLLFDTIYYLGMVAVDFSIVKNLKIIMVGALKVEILKIA